MLRLQTVVVADDAACLGPVFIVLDRTVSEETELRLALFDVEDVRVSVHRLC